MTTLETLYKPTKTGATQVCSISYHEDTFTVTYGQLHGKMQSQTTQCFTTNQGRSNERSPSQQAEFEAKALFTKKQKAGYSTSVDTPSTVKLPMKVKVYQDQIHNVKLPCISQPKLNGVNGTYRLEDGVLSLYSRGGERYPDIPHLVADVLAAMSALNSTELNGELYIHGDPLERITSAVKKPNTLSPSLEFHIFDIADSTAAYLDRFTQLSQVPPSTHVRSVPGRVCESHAELDAHFSECIAAGYEGTVIKNYSGLYQHNVRSSDQFKYKKALDAEFRVISFTLDKHQHPIYTCESSGGTFKVKRKGTASERLADAAIAHTHIGEYLTVEYEVLSSYGIPLKPVGLNFRTCNTLGEPIE